MWLHGLNNIMRCSCAGASLVVRSNIFATQHAAPLRPRRHARAAPPISTVDRQRLGRRRRVRVAVAQAAGGGAAEPADAASAAAAGAARRALNNPGARRRVGRQAARTRASVDPALSADALTVTVGGVVRPNFALNRRGLPPREAEVVLTAPVLRGRRAAVQLHTLGATSAPDGAAVVVVRPPPSPFRPASAPPPPAASPPAAADGLSRWAADAAPAAADPSSSFQPHFVVCKQLDAAALVKKVERILDSDLPFRMAVDAAGGMGVGDLHGLLERIAPKKPPTTSDTQAAFEACAGGRDKVTVAEFVATQVRARHENEEARKAPRRRRRARRRRAAAARRSRRRAGCGSPPRAPRVGAAARGGRRRPLGALARRLPRRRAAAVDVEPPEPPGGRLLVQPDARARAEGGGAAEEGCEVGAKSR